MAATVAALADAGFVSRTPDPADGRRVLIGLTPAGADALAADRRRREDWLSDAIRRDLTVEERRTLVAATALLARIAASDGAARREAGVRPRTVRVTRARRPRDERARNVAPTSRSTAETVTNHERRPLHRRSGSDPVRSG
jgi:hypothetical protein